MLRRGVPQALWLDWSVRLRPRSRVDMASFRVVAAATLGLPGSRRPVRDVVAGHSDDAAVLARKLSHVLQVVAATPNGSSILRALTQLSDGLRTHGSPIDCERRRRVAATAYAIDLRAWDRICAAAGVPTGGHRKLRHARLWVWETLTGGLPHQAPDDLRPTATSALGDYHLFVLHLPAITVNRLEAHARVALDDHGCEDEPVTWSPPVGWVDLGGLPVSDVDDLDVERLATLLRSRRSVRVIAEELDTSLDHVRLVVRRHPGLIHPGGRSRQGCMVAGATSPRNARTLPPPNLTTERLRALVVEENRTLRSLAIEFGVGRKYLAARLRREGIPVPPAYQRPVHVVDPQWLRVEYLEHRRTLPDIAAEVGTTAPNIARIARRHDIPLRGRGGPSHAANLNRPPSWPEPLGSAVVGQGAKERVWRFQVYASHRSLNEAALALSLHPSVLTTQLAQLEAACGGALLVRSPRSQQCQRVTDLGCRLLAQADEQLGLHPVAPLSLPEPLATARASFWGEKRLRWFEVAARSDSLAAAASVTGSDGHTLDRSIRGLERALDGVLLLRKVPSQPHRLSALGRMLLDQIDGHLGPWP